MIVCCFGRVWMITEVARAGFDDGDMRSGVVAHEDAGVRGLRNPGL